ncbi:MAG: hypothetical protein N3F63_01560 [Thermoplasmata archaeon]|nr:hypothetical protein [Thermoplasmata archaeon]
MRKWLVSLLVVLLIPLIPASHLQQDLGSQSENRALPSVPSGGLHSSPENPARAVEKNLIDPEFFGMEGTEKVKVYIATENLKGLAGDLRDAGINVTFGRTTTYSKLILPVIEVEPWKVPLLANLTNALFVGKTPEIEVVKPEKGVPAALPPASTSYTGNNTTTLLITDGIEFGIPALWGTYAVWGNDTDYSGYPEVFDFASLYDYLEDGMVSPTSWFVNTSFNTSAYVENGSVYIDFENNTYNVTGIPSVSSTFHVGWMPEIPGRNRSAVIVTDTGALWNYDTAYVDLNNDRSFANEQPINRTRPIRVKDLNFDGNPDISTGLLYWVSDGIHTLPHSKFVAERFGFENLVPEAGTLLCFFGDYLNGTGTQISQALIKTARNTKILPVVMRSETNLFESWLFCAFGGDYLPKSGDEKDVCLSNFLLKVHTNYWNYIDRFYTSLLASTRVLFVLPALGNPDTYSPSSVYAIYAGTYNSVSGERIISTDGWQLATVIAGSKMQLLPSFSQSMYSWGNVPEGYAGTGVSAAVTAGVVAKLVEAVKEQGLQVNPDRTREVVAFATQNTPLDVQSQGHGILDESEALALMNLTSTSMKISPIQIDFGNYQGTEYPSFCNLVNPNTSYRENITLLSQNTDRDVNIQPVILKKEAGADFSFVLDQNATGFLSLDSVLARGTTVCRISTSANDGNENGGNFDVEFYVWIDDNGNSMEEPGEIQLVYRGKMVDGFSAFSTAISNWSKIEGAFLKFLPASENPELEFNVRVEWFNYTKFEWIPEISIFLPSNFALPVGVDLSVPANATPGRYEGKLLLLSEGINKTLPYRINVAAAMDTIYELADAGFYSDNALVPGNGAPVSRWYFLDVPPEITDRWSHLVVEVNLTGNASVTPYFSYSDTFSILYRKTFGPGALISFAALGEHGFGRDGRVDTVIVPAMPGLNGIRFAFSGMGQNATIRSLRVYGINVYGEQYLESTVWRDKVEFTGISSAALNLSISAAGLQRAEEISIGLDENHTGEMWICINETGFLLVNSDRNACFSLYAVSAEKTALVGYSMDGSICIPEIRPGDYLIKGFSPQAEMNLSWVLVYGSDVTAEIYPQGENPPGTEFFFGAYLPCPSKPGNYSCVISLGLRQNSTPWYIPFSQKIIDLPPYFTELWPANGSVLRDAKISGKYRDSEGTLKTNVSQVQVYINGANVTPFCVWNASEFSVPVLLAEGNYNVTVVIADANGIPATADIQFRVDRTAPPLNVISPENYLITRESLLFVVCESEPDAMVYVNQVPAETEDPGIFFCGIHLIEGWNVVEVKAVDVAGNVAIDRRNVCLDSSPPPLTITFPATGYITRSPYITVTGVSEYGARVTVNGVSAAPDLTGKFAAGITLPEEGENQVEVIATDSAGNENRFSFVAVLDRTPPEITLDPVEPLTASSVITISGMVRDAYLDPYVYVNAMKVQVIGQKFSVPVLLSEGTNAVKIAAMDMAGNVNTRFLTVTLDTTPPPLNLTLPDKVTLAKITINGSTEPGAKLWINNVSVYVNPQGNFSYVLNLTKGVNFVTVKVSDTAGNTRILTFAVLYVNPNELNVDDINRYNTLDKKLTELLDSLIYAVIALCVVFAVGLVGLYRYMLWRSKREEKVETLKSVFEEK